MDFALLSLGFDVPKVHAAAKTFKPRPTTESCFNITEKTNTLAKWTQNSGTFREKFLINLLKAWFGDAPTAPKATRLTQKIFKQACGETRRQKRRRSHCTFDSCAD
ncbi:MAG: hypothetical protein II857_06540 [Selenomonadaceae bacterium]|nr:hypothetical protein [Selenomonadaceae bacterium]